MIQGHTRSDAHALADYLADTLAERKAGGESWGDGHALIDNPADTLAEKDTGSNR